MLILPVIDIINGKCVRLIQGNYDKRTNYAKTPLSMAKNFVNSGASYLHIIDLEGAREGKPKNAETILKIAKKLDVRIQVGGGIRTYSDAEKLLKNGITRIIMSTAALEKPELIKKLIREFGESRIIISIDARDGKVAIKGWQEQSEKNVLELIKELKKLGIATIIYTDIKRDGMMRGPNIEKIREILKTGMKVIVAGGISSLSQIKKLRSLGASGVIVGKAIYEGKIDIARALKENANAQNNLAKRIIPCMDINKGRVVKGTCFKNLRDAGDPIELGKLYSKMGADELIFLDITATVEKRKTLKKLVKKIAANINIPFTVGGGIQNLADIRALLNVGADKVAICSEAVKNPEFIKKVAKTFGSQCIVISIDAKRNPFSSAPSWQIYIAGGRTNTGIDAIEFSSLMAKYGAGELLVNSLDRDGTRKGYDIALLRTIAENVNIPIIASSGAGSRKDFLKAFTEGKCDAALGASLFHFGEISIPDLKNYLRKNNIQIR